MKSTKPSRSKTVSIASRTKRMTARGTARTKAKTGASTVRHKQIAHTLEHRERARTTGTLSNGQLRSAEFDGTAEIRQVIADAMRMVEKWLCENCHPERLARLAALETDPALKASYLRTLQGRFEVRAIYRSYCRTMRRLSIESSSEVIVGATGTTIAAA